MIHFALKFLICFSKPKSGVKDNSKKSTPKKVNDKREENLDIDENVVQCTEQVRNWCHVEYSLLENIIPKLELNVVTWGPAAKIYTKHDCRAIKTYTVGDLVWVNFTMFHNITDLDDRDVELMKNSLITFKFFQDQGKMMDHAVNDWPKTFKICKKTDEKSQCDKLFPELHQTDPLDTDYKEVIKERIEQFHMTRPERNSVVSLIQVSKREKKIEKKINELSPFLQVIQSETLTKRNKNQDKSKSKTEKKSKTNIIETKDKSKIVVKSELLIGGKHDIFEEQRDIFPALRYAAVYASSSKVLTDDQDFTFVPLTITINSIEDLPLEYLQTLKVKNIYARYELPNISNVVETEKHTLNKDVVFDQTNVFFISYLEEKNRFPQLMLRPSVLNLTEILTTRYFVLKLYGETDTSLEVPVSPCLFGDKPDDAFIATPDHEMFLNYKPPQVPSSEVFLGSACFNLIKLAKGFYKTDLSTVLNPAPITRWDPAFKLDDILDTLDNQNDRDAILKKFTTLGSIPEHLLIEHSTRVTITIAIGTLLSSLTENQLLEMPNVYNRVVMVFKKSDVAIKVFQNMLEVNAKLGAVHHRDTTTSNTSVRHSMNIAKILTVSKFDHERPTAQSIPSSKLSRTRTQSSTGLLKEIHRNFLTSNKLLTGFFIQNQDESIIVVETIPYVTSHVIEFIHSIAQDDIHIIHDSSIFFTKRIYGEFPVTKIYVVKLPSTINTLIKNSSQHIKGNTNETALQTLLLLDLLRRSRTLNCAAVHQLFPTCDQLITLNEAFGRSTFDLYHEIESASSLNKLHI